MNGKMARWVREQAKLTGIHPKIIKRAKKLADRKPQPGLQKGKRASYRHRNIPQKP